MKLRVSGLIMALFAAASVSAGEDISGRAVFDRHCVHCHAGNGEAPGTLQLARRLGPEKAVLSEREDLVGAYVQAVVRQGLNAMPSFTPGDLDDAKLEALIAYLTRRPAQR